MSSSSSSSSVPYRYPTQPRDPRASQPYYVQPNTGTSTASAYAYAQQQQQGHSHSHSSSNTNFNPNTSHTYSYLPPQVQRQPLTHAKGSPSLLADRAHSIEELAKLAAQDKYDRYADIKQDLRHAEVYHSEGKKDLEAGDLEWAFVNFARTATLVLNKMPDNIGYHDMKQAHRDALATNGNFCLEKMTEIKPKLVDRYELWRQRNPNAKPELDVPRILNAMAARDQEELAIRAQTSKEKRAASKEEAAKRAYTEEIQRAESAFRHPEPQRPGHDEEYRKLQEAANHLAEKKAYEDARRRQETRKKEAEKAGMGLEADGNRQREEEIARHKQEVARQEQEAATRRKTEELMHRRKMDESRRREQEGILQRQREVEAEAEASRNLLQAPGAPAGSLHGSPSAHFLQSPSHPASLTPSKSSSAAPSPSMTPSGQSSAASSVTLVAPQSAPMPMKVSVPDRSYSAYSSASSSSSSSGVQVITPRQQDELPILPLESPTREVSEDPRQSWHHPQPQHAVTESASLRRVLHHVPITTTSPPPAGRPVNMQYPSLMSEHQRAQGYTPSLQSMFSPPNMSNPVGGLLFRPNNPEGPSMRNMPSSPDRPPAHIRHMWEQAGYGYQYANYGTRGKPKAQPAPGDSRILRPEQVRDDAATVIGKELRIVKVPQNLLPRFLAVAAVNTARNRETCGLLMGKETGKEYKITTLLIPKQRGTSDTCTMDEEELVSEFADKRNLSTLGWIHTHPSQSCFMSSLDLHTHAGFQSLLPEFFAIVCAPKHVPDCGIFRLTDPPGLKTILKCTEKASFHPHPERPIYTDADKGHVVWVDDTGLEIVDLR